MGKRWFIFFVYLLFMTTTPAFAVDSFFVHLEDAVPKGNGKVLLIFLVQNNDSSDIISMDVEPGQGLYADKTEVEGGLGIEKRSAAVFRLLANGRLRHQMNVRFKVTVSGDIDIFRKRSTKNLMTFTSYYSDGRKMVYDVGAPVLRDLR